MTDIRDAIDAVTEASGAFTRAVGAVSADNPAILVEPAVQRLQRATSRLSTILTMHPELTLAAALPRGAWTDEDAADRAMSIDALETAATMPSEAVTVVLRTVRSLGVSREDAVREWIAGYHIYAMPDGFGYTADVTALVHEIAERYIPADLPLPDLEEDEGEEYEPIPESDSLRELRERLRRPRKEEDT